VAKNLPEKPNLKTHNHAFQDKNNVTGDKEIVDPLISTKKIMKNYNIE
jgi:hypothetical protein